MQYYPINLDLRGKRCLVVGGGDVAERKVCTLLSCEARVKVVSPEVTQSLQTLAQEGRIELCERQFAAEDMEGIFVAIASTDDAEVNSQVSRLAHETGKLVNVVDDPALCNFIVPATVKRGDLQISISTGGNSPALAKRIRRELESQYGPEYAAFAELLGELREVVKSRYAHQKEREAVFGRLLDSGILDLLADGQSEEAKKKALQCI